MIDGLDKRRVLEALRQRIEESLRNVTNSQEATRAGAVHEETRAEDPKDTRATEASYLARGLADRAEALQQVAARLTSLELRDFGGSDPVGVGALLALEGEDGGSSLVFLVGAGAGEAIKVDGRVVRPVTPKSPLGRTLTGSYLNDEIEVELPTGVQMFRIIDLA